MSKELLYLGIGAAAVYLLARTKNRAPVDTTKPAFVPGVTPGTTPGIAQQGAEDTIVKGPYSAQQWINAMKSESLSSKKSLQVVFDDYYTVADAEDKPGIEMAGKILGLTIPGSTSPVVKSGIGMAGVVVALAAGYYLIVNR